MDDKHKPPIVNETSTSVAGINTPPDGENHFPTDMVSEAVEEMMDRVRDTFQGEETRD